MTATQIRQDEATAIAAERGYRVEIHRQTTGDCWDVRIYATSTGYVKHSYNRRRDVTKANIGDAVMAMLNEFDQADAERQAFYDRYTSREGGPILHPTACTRCQMTTEAEGLPGEATYAADANGDLKAVHKHGCPKPLTTREVAAAARVGTTTRRYKLRDPADEWWIERSETDTTWLVLTALGRHDMNRMEADARKNRCVLAAAALSKCIYTGRMDATTSLRIKRYTPWQLCALVARIARDADEAQLGGICDIWLIRNHASL